MKVYITQYALSSGIVEAEVEATDKPKMVLVPGDRQRRTCSWYCHKPHWHTDRNEAVEVAERMRKKRIETLKKQLAKLRTLSFK